MNTNRYIGFILFLSLILSLPASAKKIDYGVKEQISKIKPDPSPKSTRDPQSTVNKDKKANPLLMDSLNKTTVNPLSGSTNTPIWLLPKQDGISCDQQFTGTSHYGRQCTSRFLSF